MKELLHVFFFGLALGAWQDGTSIKSYLSKDVLDERRVGHWKNHPEDHLTILTLGAESLLVGARNALFNLTTTDLKQNSFLNWTVSRDHHEDCDFKGQKNSDCHNFIRLVHGPLRHHNSQHNSHHNRITKQAPDSNNGSLEEVPSDQFVVCGTNAFKPLCRLYDPSLNNFTQEFSGVGYSPFDPSQRSTSLLHHGAVYTATVADFGGSDALIYKEPLRTEQNDLKHLSSPTFVSSVSYNESALFFFRELAVEHTNCGKVVYSRVARICQHDAGSRKHKDRFTTFLKARLNCSVPGEFPFYFDYIQGTSSVFTETGTKEEMLYAVFTTPENSLRASAICSYRLRDLLKVFDGAFKGQHSFDSNWLPVAESDVPSPRPGSCQNDSTYSPDAASVTFHKAHPLMDEAVQGTLVLTHSSNTEAFTTIEVDNSPDLGSVRILYVGTRTGKVFKVIAPASANHSDGSAIQSSMISASWQVFQAPIKSIRILSPDRILVSTETELVTLPVQHCSQYRTCTECIGLRDPHCFWDMNDGQCVSKDGIALQDGDYRQDVEAGDTQFCPIQEVAKKQEPVVELRTQAEQGNDITINDSEECCPCSTTTTATSPSPRPDIRHNRIPELDGDLRYLGGGLGEPAISFAELDPDSDSGNKITSFEPKEYESSSVRSDQGRMSSTSAVLAIVSSAILSLLIGFFIGFIGSRWLARKNKNTKMASTNAQLAASMKEQSQRLTAKPMDFVVNVNGGGTLSRNPMKNNLNTDTLEKTVKKIYL